MAMCEADDTRMVPMRAVPGLVDSMTGQLPHDSTIKRWRKHGVAGVRLKVLTVGGRYVTCRDWITQFFESVAEAKLRKAGGDCDSEPTERRRMSVERAKRKLMQAGLM